MKGDPVLHSSKAFELPLRVRPGLDIQRSNLKDNCLSSIREVQKDLQTISTQNRTCELMRARVRHGSPPQEVVTVSRLMVTEANHFKKEMMVKKGV